ncbi:UNVERIFIED_CONTAM: translocon subunit, partial [Siphonaria sp. JEL0065]
NLAVKLMGVWKNIEGIPQEFATSGIAYYISPPRTVTAITVDPIHFLVYLTFMLTACAVLSQTWIEVSGASPRDVAKQLQAQGLVLRGGSKEQTLYKELKKVIPTAAAFGGLVVGALSVGADLMGAIGSGTGILLAVTTIYQYFEIFVKENQESGAQDMFN